MASRRFILFTSVLFIASQTTFAQKKAEEKMTQQLRDDISYLASDALEGRRTGTQGELKAAEYIEKRYQKLHIAPYNNTYFHPFKFTYGKEINAASRIAINGVTIRPYTDGFPMPFSPNKKVTGDILPDVQEQGSIWLLPLFADQDEANNPHFDCEKSIFDRTKDAAKQGATAVIFYDGYDSKYAPSFNTQCIYETVEIPVAFINNATYKSTITGRTSQKSSVTIELNTNISKTERSGNNLAAYINNGAKYTVVLGAHYDHLGYGEDHNSLHANADKDHLIHHGADDNASGTAALLAMAEWIKKKRLSNFNYLFVNFSGEELGLYGSKAFVKEYGLDSNKIAYMLNMDMVGRLNDSTHALTLGGVGTSPSWAQVVTMAGKEFKLVIDSAGVGPSDHTSFYNAGIPVLFFFTGTHKDYHKPSDVANLINYPGEVSVIKYISSVVRKMDKERVKPRYTVTRQTTVGKTRFKVSLGIMPDYTFDAGGVRVDGVTENRPAFKAGVKAGDIITSLGSNKITGMQSYMEALGKFSPGEKTTLTLLREGKEIVLPIELNK